MFVIVDMVNFSDRIYLFNYLYAYINLFIYLFIESPMSVFWDES